MQIPELKGQLNRLEKRLQRLTGVILFTAFFAGGIQLYLADAVSLAIACGAAGLITLAWTLFSR